MSIISPIISGWFGWLWQVSWQASAVVLPVLAVQGVLGRRLAARWRYALWFWCWRGWCCRCCRRVG
jgi:hypothetical protein